MHLTDEQLNEYLDNETAERAQIEEHLTACDECAARFSALKALFAEIESLPELELTQSIAARITTTPSLPARLPPSLTLTVTLQAVGALIALFFAAPIIRQYFASVLPAVSIPSFYDVLIEIQIYFAMWMRSFQSFQLPTIPTEILSLPKEIPPAILSVILLGILIIWLIGNWWLLRKRPNPLA